MRPAHYAREVCRTFSSAGLPPACFNEARALCAGSRRDGRRLRPAPARFNEARALCAGSPCARTPDTPSAGASMRPAHYAREVLRVVSPLQRRNFRFNEARALCAGSPVGAVLHDRPSHRLQ